MTPSRRILLAEPLDFSPRALAILQQAGEVELRGCSSAGLANAFQEYDVVWFRLASRITEAMLGANPRCQVLATPVTGIDHIDLCACEKRGIKVVSLRGEVEFLCNIRAAAELTVAMAFAVMRRIPQAAKSVLSGKWNRDQFRGNELFEKTAGIVGVGRLGSIVANYLHAFGMQVLGYDPQADFSHLPAEQVVTLDELLQRSDLIFLLVSYGPTTRHLMGPRQFAAMRPGAFLVNTSRGGVVDEAALIDALATGHLAGAALDVLEGEPDVTPAQPLVSFAQSHDNLLITPHIGGNTWESFEKTEVFLARRVLAELQRLDKQDMGIVSTQTVA